MVAIYTVLAGGVTVGGVYVLSHSGLYILGTAAVGMAFLGLGGGSVGAVSARATEGTEEAEISQMTSGSVGAGTATKVGAARLVLVLYGVGLLLWSIIVLTFFRSGLH
jgi:hypothetical protein